MKNFFCCKICQLLCLPPCPRHIMENFAFQPPIPTYDLPKDDVTGGYLLQINDDLLTVMRLSMGHNLMTSLNKTEVTYVNTKHSTKIVCVYCAVEPPSKTTILYSHGNASDLGTVALLCVWLAENTRCNILAYDYSGYGRSTGKPSEKRIYGDIEAAYNLLLEKYHCSPHDIVLMGQSLGSAPTIDLAARMPVKGVVVQSGFASAINVAFPQKQYKSVRWCDFFENINKVGKITVPLLIIHGTEDEVIDMWHGDALYRNCPQAVEPLWVPGAGHNDVENYSQFLQRLIRFLNVDLS